MTRAPFSPPTVKTLVEVITGGAGMGLGWAEPTGIYRSGPAIEALLRDCGLTFQLAGGSRLPTLTAYLHDLLGQPEGAEAVARVLLRVAEPEDYGAEPARQQAVIARLNRALARDKREIVLDHDRRPQLVARGRPGAVVGTSATGTATLNLDAVQREIARALASAESDPEDAVTAACSIVETICRSVLVELRLPLPAERDIDGLVRAVQEPLGLSPIRTGLPAGIAAGVRQVLDGLATTAQGLGALRTHADDAHGRERGSARVDGRIARLAVHAAGAQALFLVETWERRQRRTLPRAAEEPRA